MAYIGPAPNPGQNREVDDISSGFNGSEVNFTLQVNSQNVSPGSANAIIVSLGGVVQNPGTDYTVAASTLTFTTAPASGLSFFGLVLGQQVDTEGTADGSISGTKLTNPLDLVDNQKIRFGTGNDIEVYSDGSNGYITHTDNGGDPLYISSQNDIRLRVANTEEGVKIKSNGEVELYHNNTLVTNTESYGLKVKHSNDSGAATLKLENNSTHNSQTPRFDIAVDLANGKNGGSVQFIRGNNYQSSAAADSEIVINPAKNDSNIEVVRITQDYVRLHSNASGIQFNSDTASANALDDYEEGVWTPTVTGGIDGGAQYASNLGWYTKIGRFVHLTFYIQFVNATTGSQGNGNAATLGGIPFTVYNTSGYNSGGIIQYTSMSMSGSSQIALYTENNSSTIWLYRDRMSAATWTTGANDNKAKTMYGMMTYVTAS